MVRLACCCCTIIVIALQGVSDVSQVEIISLFYRNVEIHTQAYFHTRVQLLSPAPMYVIAFSISKGASHEEMFSFLHNVHGLQEKSQTKTQIVMGDQ